MRLTHIAIDNLAGLNFESALPAIALIQGHNGAGKTSLKLVITYAFGRNIDGTRAIFHDSRMVLTGEKGEATLTFDDGMQLRVLVTKDSTTRMTKPKDGKRWGRTGTEIEALANAISYDPILLRTLPEAKRIEMLLRVCPVAVSMEEIVAAIGDVAMGAPHEASLEAINAYHDDIYKLRTVENVSADTQEKHAQELMLALPKMPEGAPVDANTLRQQKEALEESLRGYTKVVGDTFRKVEASENNAHASRCLAIDTDINAKIAAMEKERTDRRESSLAERSKLVEAARAEANATVVAKQIEVAPERDRLTAEIAEAEVLATAIAQAEGGRAAHDVAIRSARYHRERSLSMTAALDRLKALKQEVAGRMAIKGITIASPGEGLPVDICREEKGVLVPFSLWNDTSKILFCLRVAVLSHGKCGLVCVDSIDAIDDSTRAALLAQCKKYAELEGMQFLLGKVAEGPLRVEGVEAAEVGA